MIMNLNENTSAASIVEIGDSDEFEPAIEPTVRFNPPLFEQRRAWVLNMLRRNRVKSIVDIGCGEGSLLACLCNPALYVSSSNSSNQQQNKISKILPNENSNPALDTNIVDIDDGEYPELHIKKLDGLDISSPDLECAIKATAPLDNNTLERYGTFPRWEQLDVRIWRGGLEWFNEELVGAECIVAMEVIEHLPPDIFPSFAPILLGSYRPKYLLITTPSYTFNARFTSPAFDASASYRTNGFKDPTERTERVFRHADHKFEWTVEEFNMYCNEVARMYGYDVDVGGVGKAVEEDPWGRDEELGFATQVAAFTKKDDFEIVSSSIANPTEGVVNHELLVTHHYNAHPHAGQVEAPDVIQNKVLDAMSSYRVRDGWTIYDLWVEEDISVMCGGALNELIDVIEECGYLSVEKGQSRSVLKWVVKLTEEAISTLNIQDEVMQQNFWDEQEQENPGWREEDVNEDAYDDIVELDYELEEDEHIWAPINEDEGRWSVNVDDDDEGWGYTGAWSTSDGGQNLLS